MTAHEPWLTTPYGSGAADGPTVENPAATRRVTPTGTLLVLFAIGAAVALTLGVYGGVHEPASLAVNIAGFSGPQAVKVWLTTGVLLLAVLQGISAAGMYGRLPGLSGGWWSPVHRWSGRLAFLLSVPVAIHCLYALGFGAYEPRVLLHSLLGCLFYGALSTKLLGLTRKGLPGWFLPILGSVVLTLLVGLWMSSALWFFTTSGVHL